MHYLAHLHYEKSFITRKTCNFGPKSRNFWSGDLTVFKEESDSISPTQLPSETEGRFS